MGRGYTANSGAWQKLSCGTLCPAYGRNGISSHTLRVVLIVVISPRDCAYISLPYWGDLADDYARLQIPGVSNGTSVTVQLEYLAAISPIIPHVEREEKEGCDNTWPYDDSRFMKESSPGYSPLQTGSWSASARF